MEICIIVGAILVVSLIIGFALPIDLPGNSPDTFPDDKFLITCKKYSSKEIAEALDGIGNGI